MFEPNESITSKPMGKSKAPEENRLPPVIPNTINGRPNISNEDRNGLLNAFIYESCQRIIQIPGFIWNNLHVLGTIKSYPFFYKIYTTL